MLCQITNLSNKMIKRGFSFLFIKPHFAKIQGSIRSTELSPQEADNKSIAGKWNSFQCKTWPAHWRKFEMKRHCRTFRVQSPSGCSCAKTAFPDWGIRQWSLVKSPTAGLYPNQAAPKNVIVRVVQANFLSIYSNRFQAPPNLSTTQARMVAFLLWDCDPKKVASFDAAYRFVWELTRWWNCYSKWGDPQTHFPTKSQVVFRPIGLN